MSMSVQGYSGNRYYNSVAMRSRMEARMASGPEVTPVTAVAPVSGVTAETGRASGPVATYRPSSEERTPSPDFSAEATGLRTNRRASSVLADVGPDIGLNTEDNEIDDDTEISVDDSVIDGDTGAGADNGTDSGGSSVTDWLESLKNSMVSSKWELFQWSISKTLEKQEWVLAFQEVTDLINSRYNEYFAGKYGYHTSGSGSTLSSMINFLV